MRRSPLPATEDGAMTTEPDTTVDLRWTVNGSPETVFRAWTEPDQLERWCTPKGDEVVEAGTDLMVGGKYRLSMKDADGRTHTARGEYREIERPVLVAFTWAWEDTEDRVGETVVTVRLKRADDESTEVLLNHELFPGAAETESHRNGWAKALEKLERVVPIS